MNRLTRISIAVLVAGGLWGCTSTQPPTISVLEARVADRTEQGVVIEFLIEADNPNDAALPLRKVDYTVSIAGDRVFAGTRSPEATIRRFGRQRFTFPASFAAGPGVIAGEVEYEVSGEVKYVVAGAITQTLLDEEYSELSAPFQGSGRLKIPDTTK
ncbi:MAG: LEA type 2 family protein [Phycisphaerae bacterium]|nr:LEA type 2 family protein [Phycisphaerae bacterium]